MTTPALLVVMKITIGLLMVAFVLVLIRLAKGPHLYDRVVAFDLITSLVAGIALVYGMLNDVPFFMDVAVIIFLISFLGTVAISKYLSKNEPHE
ncbi:monovalent cation/H+ antiporter complex subunit F [Gaoshiqia sediminis]|uniref:Monovalent cation/H+ antiporter complex subunit F n=1 Tax=Gaoshiqia sediminis TaxID=2986998 RepID=A0AA42C6R5_9BACT|nr:monovalent cation/H+ antiporter complex subunit F [Gaoshiqia sediminis]MCW0482809.1 monovalent cation/H+ antiporter complex subunit F [Gaoshiqia sediminis]